MIDREREDGLDVRSTDSDDNPSNPMEEERLAEIRRRSIWQKLIDQFYGYDFFISYRWSDGRQYALQLAEGLKSKGYNSFLDSEVYRPGENWLLGGHYAIKHTSRLVFLATRDAVLVPRGRPQRKDPIIEELQAFEKGGRQKVRVLLDKIEDSEWEQSPKARFFRLEDLYLTDLDRSTTNVVSELDRWARIDKIERKRTHLFQGISVSLAVLLIVALIGGLLARSQSNRLRLVAAEGLIRGGYENLSREDNAAAASDFASALEIEPGNQIAVDRLYSLLAHGTPQWVLQQRFSVRDDIFAIVTGSDWMEVPESGLDPVSINTDDDADRSESITTSRFESPDGSWTVELVHYSGNFQSAQLPYYQIRLSEQVIHSFEDMREVKGISFNQASTFVAVALDTDEVHVFNREGSVTDLEYDGVDAISFVDERFLVCHVGDSELLFKDLQEQDAAPILFTGAQILAYTRNESHLYVATRTGNVDSLWTYPLTVQTMSRVVEARTTGPRFWQERAKLAPDRDLSLEGIDGDWVVTGPGAKTSDWKVCGHPLSDEDADEKAAKDETYSASTASIFTDAAISANGKVIVTSAGRMKPRIWREGIQTWEQELDIDIERYVYAVKLDETGELAFVLYSDEGPTRPMGYDLFTTKTGKRIAEDVFNRADELVDVSRDCRKLLVRVDPTGNPTFEVRSTQSIDDVVQIPAAQSGVFSDDAKRLAMCSQTGVVSITDLESKYLLSEPLTFPGGTNSDSFREPHFSRDGEFVELHKFGDPGRRCAWRVRLNLPNYEVFKLVTLARQYYGVDIDARRTAPEIVEELFSNEDSLLAELASFLLAFETPK